MKPWLNWTPVEDVQGHCLATASFTKRIVS